MTTMIDVDSDELSTLEGGFDLALYLWIACLESPTRDAFGPVC